MNVDVEVYLSGIVKFFKDNPKDLLSLVPKEKEEDFYKLIRKYSFENYEKGEDYILTKNQILEICVQLNESHKQSPKVLSQKETEMETLQYMLEEAIKNEEYEIAAELRDQIKNIV
jgi:excinuclease UvrABC helicase subunit UvrB